MTRALQRLVVLALLVAGAPARAETFTVGLFAPAAPFEGAAARVDTATAARWSSFVPNACM